MTTLYANPYDPSARGFYFDSAEQFEQRFQANLPVEEYAIEFIDGDSTDAQLFEAAGITQASLEEWFDDLEPLDDHEKAALYWLMADVGYSREDALAKVEDARVYEGLAKDYVFDLVEDIGVENISNPDYYFDFEAFGRDLAFDMDSDDEGDAYYLSLSDQERGEEYVESMGGVGELGAKIAAMYFDYDALTRDMLMNSEIAEFDFAGATWTMPDASQF